MKTYRGNYLNSGELRSHGCRAVREDVLVHDTCVLVGLEHRSKTTFGWTHSVA